MIKVGVTGGIGSGKTTICKLLEILNYSVYYSDIRAKWIMNHDSECKDLIVKEFGEDAYMDGALNRDFLAKNVFKDPSKLEKLNSIVHPLVQLDYKNWLAQRNGQKVTVKEAALIFETGAEKFLNKTIVVRADDDVRMERVLMRDKHRNKQQVEHIIASQMQQSEKEGLADYVIDNSGDKLVIPQVLSILNSIENDA